MSALWAIVCAVRSAGPADASTWSAFGFGAFALGLAIIAGARWLIARRLMQESDPPRDFSIA